jgi:hypothetical protein
VGELSLDASLRPRLLRGGFFIGTRYRVQPFKHTAKLIRQGLIGNMRHCGQFITATIGAKCSDDLQGIRGRWRFCEVTHIKSQQFANVHQDADVFFVDPHTYGTNAWEWRSVSTLSIQNVGCAVAPEDWRPPRMSRLALRPLQDLD